MAPAAVEHDLLQARTDYEALLQGENKRVIRWERGWVSRTRRWSTVDGASLRTGHYGRLHLHREPPAPEVMP
jgi:hypothetical protein